MIVEGIVTTLGPEGRVNISPMGPRAEPDFRRLTLRPFRSSRTYQNLKAHGEGVFHVTDDVELLARAAVGEVQAELKPAQAVRGWILAGACRAYEFRILSIDESAERASLDAEVVRSERLRDFYGFNRAKHAVVEAAILATRLHLIPRVEILTKLEDLAVLVQKTGSPGEERAFAFLRSFVESAPRVKSDRVRVRTGSRLHFGLVWPGEGGPRRFGGAGAMVSEPGIEVLVERSEGLDVEGPLADRAMELARSAAGVESPGLRIRVLSSPRHHIGLGTGTQLGLAIARGIAALEGESPPVEELASRTGRGLRSAIGVHGFARGGLLIDGGLSAGSAIAPLVTRIEIPASWRFVLAAPEGPVGLFGGAEEASFRELEDVAESSAHALCHSLLMGIAPALIEGDARAFGESLFEYGRRSGELFKKVQGGAFASPAIAGLVEFSRRLGFPGAGQSSWGPTVYVLATSPEEGAFVAGRIRERFGESAGPIVITPPLNCGASVETSNP